MGLYDEIKKFEENVEVGSVGARVSTYHDRREVEVTIENMTTSEVMFAVNKIIKLVGEDINLSTEEIYLLLIQTNRSMGEE